MNILTIIDNKVEKTDKWLWYYLKKEEYDRHTFDFIWHDLSPIKRKNRFVYLGKYSFLGLKAFIKSFKYDAVISWEAKCGLVFAFLQRLFKKKSTKHILLGFIYKKEIRKFTCITRWALLSVSKIVVFSKGEIEKYSKAFSMPKEKFIFIPLVDFYSFEYKNILIEASDENYIFTVGTSNRDYKTLADCARKMTNNFKIVTFKTDVEGINFSKNVEIKFNIYGKALNDLLAKSKIVVIPLNDPSFAAGQLALLKAMAMGKPIVITENIGIIDYVEDDETAIIVKPNEPDKLKDALTYLLKNPEVAKKMGERALKSSKNNTIEIFAQNIMELIRNTKNME